MRQRYPGRPRVEPQTGKKTTIGLRVAPSLKEKLIREAERSDRTLSQVIELRLEASLRDEQVVEGVLDRLYGPWVAGLLMAIGRLAQQIAGPGDPDHLLSLAYPFAQFARSTAELIGNYQPDGGPRWEAELRARAERDGEASARYLLEELRDPTKRRLPMVASIAARLPLPDRPPGAGEERTMP